MIRYELYRGGVSGGLFCRLSRTWPILLGGKNARAVAASNAQTTRGHRRAGRIAETASVSSDRSSQDRSKAKPDVVVQIPVAFELR